MIEALKAAGARQVDARRDNKNSISSSVIRCVYDSKRAVAVAPSQTAETQIKSLLDLLDVHLENVPAGEPVAGDEVVVLLQAGPHVDEVRDALAALIAALRGGPSVSVVLLADNGDVTPMAMSVPDYESADSYARWPGLLRAAQRAGAPELLEVLWEDVDHESLRAYPMLSGFPDWSLRLEGLEVGTIREGSGSLGVGKTSATGRNSPARALWLSATGLSEAYAFGPDSIKQASYLLQSFAKEWLPQLTPGHGLDIKQNEHALESRILRGACPLTTSSGEQLSLLEEHYVINSGSQFPTRWGRVSRGSARYLDGLLKHGRTPWALEMKVEGPAGVGKYYRHAVGQAVLYRHFIRSASPLHFWFEKYDVDPTQCQAAVVVPELTRQPVWRARLQRMCALFDVDLIEVPATFAGLSRLDL